MGLEILRIDLPPCAAPVEWAYKTQLQAGGILVDGAWNRKHPSVACNCAYKHIDKRRGTAIEGYADRARFARSTSSTCRCNGAVPIETPGFAARLVLREGLNMVIVEDASRFASELVTRELEILALIKRGPRFSLPTATTLPTADTARQISGSSLSTKRPGLLQSLSARMQAAHRASARAARAMPRSIRRWCCSLRGCSSTSTTIPCGSSLPIRARLRQSERQWYSSASGASMLAVSRSPSSSWFYLSGMAAASLS